MAEVPKDSLQRAQWGFSIWWAGEPDAPFPDEFVQMASIMGLELPGYFKQAEYIATGQLITARGAVEIYEGTIFPWESRVPMVALDGRLVAFMLTRWRIDIEMRLGSIYDIAQSAMKDDVYSAIAYGHDTMIGRHLSNIATLEALIEEAGRIGIPVWKDLSPLLPESAGAYMPIYIMVPATVIEDWSAVLAESAILLADAQDSIATGSPTGIVAEYKEQAKSKARQDRWLSGPTLVGIAALGLTVFGMFMAVRTGRVSRARDIQ